MKTNCSVKRRRERRKERKDIPRSTEIWDSATSVIQTGIVSSFVRWRRQCSTTSRNGGTSANARRSAYVAWGWRVTDRRDASALVIRSSVGKPRRWSMWPAKIVLTTIPLKGKRQDFTTGFVTVSLTSGRTPEGWKERLVGVRREVQVQNRARQGASFHNRMSLFCAAYCEIQIVIWSPL